MNHFPDLEPDVFDALLLDIEQRGIVYPVIYDQDGTIIDGHQRQRAAAALGIEPPTKTIEVRDDAEREALAIALNVHRRQLTPKQRREYILRLAPTGMTQAEIGAAVGVSQGEVSKTISEAPAEVIPRNNPSPEPLTDKQGRPPEQRGGRPRKTHKDVSTPPPAALSKTEQESEAITAAIDFISGIARDTGAVHPPTSQVASLREVVIDYLAWRYGDKE